MNHLKLSLLGRKQNRNDDFTRKNNESTSPYDLLFLNANLAAFRHLKSLSSSPPRPCTTPIF